GAKATGVLTFRVPPLAPQGSNRVWFRSRLVRNLPVRAGIYTPLVCADIGSQIRRFTQNTNCSAGARLVVSARSRPKASGPAPNTILRAGLTGVRRSWAAVFRFISTIRRSSFECSLDGGPWIACRSPKRYPALVSGRHTLDTSAISPSGKSDPTPAHQSWTV